MKSSPSQAMILAAGLGKRMRPLTDNCPKPLIEVAGRAMIDRAIDRIVEAGISRIVVNTSYLAEQLETHLAENHNLDIIISRESSPLETGGGIAKALHHFADAPFFVVNGDIIWRDIKQPFALQRLADHWHDGLDALLLLHPAEKAIGYDGKGDFFLRGDELIRRGEKASAPYVYAGVQLLHPRLFTDAPQGIFSLNILYDRALAATPPRLAAIIHTGDWLHVGDITGKAEAERYLQSL